MYGKTSVIGIYVKALKTYNLLIIVDFRNSAALV